jgi:hypothetical protein
MWSHEAPCPNASGATCSFDSDASWAPPRETEYEAKLAAAGFEAISSEPTRVYDIEDARVFLTDKGINVDVIAPQVESKFMSGFIRAVKPRPLAK